MFEDYYRTLGIDKTADSETIKLKYRDLAKKYHPDKNKSTGETFKRISEAYTVLSDPDKRAEYNLKWEYYHFQQQATTSNFTTSYPSSEPPVQTQSTVYDFRKKEYTPKAWMYGKIVIFLIITLALLIPYGGYYFSSVYYYNQGVELEEQGNYPEAYNSYISALSRWGARNLESAYAAGMIQLNRGAARESLPFFLACYDYTNSDSVETWLHFRTAIAFSYIGQYEAALEELDQIRTNGFLEDSVIMMSAEIRIFRARQYEKGLEDYQTLISRNIEPKQSWFGMGWGYQNLWNYPKAIEAYTKSLENDSTYAIAYFYRAFSHAYNGDSTQACMDLGKAAALDYPDAESSRDEICRGAANTPVGSLENDD